MALLLFCITSISAPTIPDVGAGVGGPDSEPSDTFLVKKNNKIKSVIIIFTPQFSCSIISFMTLNIKNIAQYCKKRIERELLKKKKINQTNRQKVLEGKA